MTTKLSHLSIALGVALGGLLAPTVGSAAPFDTLYFEQRAGIDGSTLTIGSPVGTDGRTLITQLSNQVTVVSPNDAYANLNWYFSDTSVPPYLPGGSGLQIDTFESNGVQADLATSSSSGFDPSGVLIPEGDVNEDGLWQAGEWWAISRLTHKNIIIRGYGILWSADVLGNLKIFSDAGHSDLLLPDDSSINITLNETWNLGGSCPDGNPLGGICDDIYTAELAGFEDISFIVDDYKYTISFDLDTPLYQPDSIPGVADPGSWYPAVATLPDGIKVWTREGNPGYTAINVVAKWEVQRIPEPATLAVLGLGLAGMGVSLRRRKVRR
jgi:hypothetical protein